MLTNKRLSKWFSLGLLVFSVSYFGSGNSVNADTPSLDSVFVQPSSSSDDLDTFFVDLDRNGEFSDPLEAITFIKKSLGFGPRTMWVRNREYGGHRVFKGPALTAAVALPDFVFQEEFWMREIQRQRGNSESR